MSKKTKHQQRIEEFMLKAGQEVPESPTIPSKEIRELRAALIMEECLETIRALGFVPVVDDQEMTQEVRFVEVQAPDLEQIADGCADISVVTIGTLSACGIPDKKLLRMVDKSNLAKFEMICPECGYVYASEPPYQGSHKNLICGYCGNSSPEKDWEGRRRSDGKWIKPKGWKAPDIATMLLSQKKKG